MNTGIQCLAATPELVKYFINRPDENSKEHHFEIDKKFGRQWSQMDGRVAEAFNSIVRGLYLENGPYNMEAEKKVFSQMKGCQMYGGNGQHDADQFTNNVMTGLQNDLTRIEKITTEQKIIYFKSPEEAMQAADERNPNQNIITDLMNIKLLKTSECPGCHKLSYGYEMRTAFN